MPVRLTAYLPEGAAERIALAADVPLVLGRGDDCDVRLPHASVSRRHAELELVGDVWRLRDLGSKNGSFVEGLPADGRPVTGRGWIRLGDVACEVEPIDAAALARDLAEPARRRLAATALTQAIARDPARPDLIDATLAAVIELAGAERGMLLVPGESDLVPSASRGFDATAATGLRPGSRAALARAVDSRRAVVIHDLSLDEELSRRASVVAGGLRALACLPLVLGDELLGVVYADSRSPGAVVTRLDLELLEAFAERATLWLAARQHQAALASASALPSKEAR